jgi:hypothetical protein
LSIEVKADTQKPLRSDSAAGTWLPQSHWHLVRSRQHPFKFDHRGQLSCNLLDRSANRKTLQGWIPSLPRRSVVPGRGQKTSLSRRPDGSGRRVREYPGVMIPPTPCPYIQLHMTVSYGTDRVWGFIPSNVRTLAPQIQALDQPDAAARPESLEYKWTGGLFGWIYVSFLGRGPTR